MPKTKCHLLYLSDGQRGYGIAGGSEGPQLIPGQEIRISQPPWNVYDIQGQRQKCRETSGLIQWAQKDTFFFNWR